MKTPDDESPEKLRGGFYTPKHIAGFLAKWAATGARHTLEPSAGDGVFLKVMSELELPPQEVTAIELDSVEAGKAKQNLQGLSGEVLNQNYLDYEPTKPIDSIVGNPPFIRYQYLNTRTQQEAQALYRALGLRFTKHTNAWVPFLIKSLSELQPGGRLGMVVPAELLNVLHAGAAREYLLQTCEAVLVLDADSLLFDGTLQRTVLLAAVRRRRGFTGRPSVAFEKINSNSLRRLSLTDIFENADYIEREVSSEKWMDGLLTGQERQAIAALSNHSCIKQFSELATVQVGIVTGANSFFMVNRTLADRFDLHAYLRPMFGRSSHVRGISYAKADHRRNLEADLPCLFLDLNAYQWRDLAPGVQAYLRSGESLGLHLRYKTRIRDPWWHVPSVYSTDIALLKRANEAPRLISNEMKALTTDTAYRITSRIGADLLTACWFNSLTLLACELNGRTYGGGVLELVPSEIRKTPIPIIGNGVSLKSLDVSLRKNVPIQELLNQQNERIALSMGVDRDALVVLEAARQKMVARRTRRTY